MLSYVVEVKKMSNRISRLILFFIIIIFISDFLSLNDFLSGDLFGFPIIFFIVIWLIFGKTTRRNIRKPYPRHSATNFDCKKRPAKPKTKVKNIECEYCGHFNDASKKYRESCGAQILDF